MNYNAQTRPVRSIIAGNHDVELPTPARIVA